jgi:CRP-like cAMP-binding protein
MKDSDLLTFLKRVPLLADLNDAALAMLARVSRVQKIPRGATLFNQDDEGDAAYIVRDGCIAIVLNTPDGRELVINEMRAGDCFGELALLTDAPRSASAVAGEASELVVIPHEEFLAELEREPKLVRQLIGLIAERLRVSSERERALAFLDAPARLARMLLQLDRASSKEGVVRMAQEELAQRIGATRQTTAKILGQWRRKGWIITGRGRIVVLDRAALRQVTGDT